MKSVAVLQLHRGMGKTARARKMQTLSAINTPRHCVRPSVKNVLGFILR